MRCVIVLAGEIRDDQAARDWLKEAGRVICADGGARHLRRLEFRPDMLVGDLDSISEEDLTWLNSQSVPVRKFPVSKDETDSELAILTTLEDLPEPRFLHEIIVLAALGSRPDHVLANQMMAAQLAAEGWRLMLTDGVTCIYTLTAGQTLVLEPDSSQAISAIPVAGPVSGLTYEGLLYPLDNVTLPMGSTRGVSNRVYANPIKIKLTSGVLLVIVTPED